MFDQLPWLYIIVLEIKSHDQLSLVHNIFCFLIGTQMSWTHLGHQCIGISISSGVWAKAYSLLPALSVSLQAIIFAVWISICKFPLNKACPRVKTSPICPSRDSGHILVGSAPSKYSLIELFFKKVVTVKVSSAS